MSDLSKLIILFLGCNPVSSFGIRVFRLIIRERPNTCHFVIIGKSLLALDYVLGTLVDELG
jgi:hypothetical protein